MSGTELRLLLHSTRIAPEEIPDLVAFLDGHDDALTVARSSVPAAYFPLAHLLSVHSGVDVAQPECSACGHATFFLPHIAADGRWCARCVGRLTRCWRCGTSGGRQTITPEGPICSPCRRGLRSPPRARAKPKKAEARRRRCTYLPCALCGKVSRVAALWPLGAVGGCCRGKVISAKTPCAVCRTVLPLIGSGADGARICGPCAGSPLTFACRTCGATGDNYSARSCRRCALTDRVTKLLMGPDGTISARWAALHAKLAASDTPSATIHWIQATKGSRLLRQLVIDDIPVTHEHLDTLAPSRTVNSVRDLLVRCAVLPERDAEYIDRIDPWLRNLMADAPPHHLHVLGPFARWYLLPKARRAAHRRGVGQSAPTTIPSTVLAASRFLHWLDSQHLALAELSQSHVDEWLDSGRGHYRYLYPFITWTRTHGLIPTGIRAPFPQYPQRLPLLDDDERLHQLRRCLDDEDLPLTLRVAGALTLLYGLPVTTIVRLRHDQVATTTTGTSLKLAEHRLALPPRLATLLERLAAEPPAPHEVPGLRKQTSPLLFPGAAGTRPIAANTLSHRLAGHGLAGLTARNSARLALAARLPASVLAQLTGIEVDTAAEWNHRAGHDWTSYVAARPSLPDDVQTSGEISLRRTASRGAP
ncbi:hypothetical protein [Amycolatopsis thailandensis]|nr:hypothetical protein [Amycolatopsis thailandensis]